MPRVRMPPAAARRWGPIVALLLLTGGGAVEAQTASRWMIRTRALAVLPNESFTPRLPGAVYDVSVSSDWVVGADLSYRVTRLFAAELALATSGHDVALTAGSEGSLRMVYPMLLLQLHPLRHPRLDPYLGGGGNLTYVYDHSGTLRRFDFSTSAGWVAQAGCDVSIGERLSLNLDIKYLSMATDLSRGGAMAVTVRVDPVLVGAGLGYRF